MKVLLSALLTVTASLAANAQGEGPPESLTQLQAELVRLLEKNGSYSIGSQDHRLKNIRFSGCRMSFESEAIIKPLNTVSPPPDGDMRTQGKFPVRPDVKSSIHFSFDLSEINPSEIAQRLERGKTETLVMPTIDRDDVVEYRVQISQSPPRVLLVNSVALTVRKKAILQVKEKLIAAMRICQQ